MLSKQRRSITLTGVLLLAAPPAQAVPEQRPEPPPRTASERYGEQLITTGRVTKVADGVSSGAITGTTARVRGVLRPFAKVELKDSDSWNAPDKRTRQRFARLPVLVASSFEATPDGTLRTELSQVRQIGTRQDTQTEPRGEPVRITLRPATLADSINEFAGQRVKILNARVVGVFEPRAFLIESATRYETALGFRDRVLVLVDAASLRVSQELLVGSTVIILGVARTLLGVRVSPELPWPAKLTPELIERLEVRAAVVATSVQTPEGIELTDRAPGGSETPR